MRPGARGTFVPEIKRVSTTAPFHLSSNLATHQAPFEQPGPCRTVSDKGSDLPLHAAWARSSLGPDLLASSGY